MAEADRRRVAAVLAADAGLEAWARLAAALERHAHEPARQHAVAVAVPADEQAQREADRHQAMLAPGRGRRQGDRRACDVTMAFALEPAPQPVVIVDRQRHRGAARGQEAQRRPDRDAPGRRSEGLEAAEPAPVAPRRDRQIGRAEQAAGIRALLASVPAAPLQDDLARLRDRINEAQAMMARGDFTGALAAHGEIEAIAGRLGNHGAIAAAVRSRPDQGSTPPGSIM